VAQLAAARNYNVSVVAEDIEPPILYDLVNKLRGHFGLKMLKMGSSEVLTVYRLLRNNEVLMLAVDRDISHDGIPVQFFDTPANMPHGAVALALRTGSAIIPGYTMRLPDNTSVVVLEDPLELERTGNREEDERTNMRKIAQTLERYILKAPDQWVVLQRIWNKEYTKDQEPGIGDRNGHSNEEVPTEQRELAPTSNQNSAP
jgi:KDO2-lipid IV(A) lauroyltransferase